MQQPNASHDVSNYSRWTEILRSWFWRFYDHLLLLILCNFSWALTCFGLAWLVHHLGWIDLSKQINIDVFSRIYGLYSIESAISVGWAYWVFKIIIEGDGNLKDIWAGIRFYFLKAVGLAIVSGLVTSLIFYNTFYYFSTYHQSHHFFSLLLTAFCIWILVIWMSSCLYQWPILFFQNPPFFRIYYKSCILALANGLVSFGILVIFTLCFGFFSLVQFLWFFIGPVFFFSFQCVALEKHLLRYKIIYKDKPLDLCLELLDRERQRGWRDFFKPWETR